METPTPCTSKCLTLTLPAHLFAWVSDMATIHNYGSVHKSVRDLLAWAAAAQPEDLDWIFGTRHDLHVQKLQSQLQEKKHHHVQNLDAPHSACVAVEARLSHFLQNWIAFCVDHYHLDGPSQLFDAVCRCAIELDAADDIFESDECGHDLPASTVDLYHDLGINGFCASRVPDSLPQ